MKKNITEEKRIKILTKNEIDAMYGIPVFNDDERLSYFSVSPKEEEVLNSLRGIKTKAVFILQLGYFKAKQMFFNFNLTNIEVKVDLKYILNKYFGNIEFFDNSKINKNTWSKHQNIILELVEYRSYTKEIQKQLESKATSLVMLSSRPLYVFREIINYLETQKVVIPGYSSFQNLIGKALTNERKRLCNILQEYLSQDSLSLLDRLLENSSGLYIITEIKHEPKDFKYSELKKEIQRGEQIYALYLHAKAILSKLNISNESIKYNASLVNYYSVYKLKRLDKWLTYLYLLCFIFHRYQQISDNMINIFIYKVSNYLRESKEKAKEAVYEMSIENDTNLKKAGIVLKLFLDEKIDLLTPFGDVKRKAFEILDELKLEEVATKIMKTQKLDETIFQWKYIDLLTKQFQQNLKPIILSLNLESTSKEEPLMESYRFIKDAFIKGKSLNTYSSDIFPINFIPNSMKKYILNKQKIMVNRYIFYVYMLLRNKLASGDVFCYESTKYRSFDDDLIENSIWENKDNIIREIGLTKLCIPINEHLDSLEKRLEKRIIEVNNRISSGENNYFEIKRIGKNTKWVLKYPSETEEINHRFFSEVKSLDISDIIHYANDKCLFTDAFEHILGKYTKQTKDINAIIACLIAWGTNMGLLRMSEISDIDYHKLVSISDNFFRLETLEAANDLVCNKISNLLIFELYKIDDIIHSSSDGQKKEVLTSTINARHSPKYFGLNKGVVEYNLVANNIPINAKIIGANEHESHFVYDILYSNTTNIKPEIHSTDTNGTNEVNFAILDFFGYQFAPRYKDTRNVVNEHLYGFQHPTFYDGIIKPVRKINKELSLKILSDGVIVKNMQNKITII